MTRQNLWFLFLAFLCLSACEPGDTSSGMQEEHLVILVRHAERADDSPPGATTAMDQEVAEDPPLSQAGLARATLLARMLKDVGITHVHSTDTRRTLETAAPLATSLGLEVLKYDPSDLEGFAERLRSLPGRHLVVGHSNTTPRLVNALGGDPGEPIESLEYDRLYIVTIRGDSVSTVLLRFGEP